MMSSSNAPNFSLQIVNATPYALNLTSSPTVQMTWNPPQQIPANTANTISNNPFNAAFSANSTNENTASATYQLAGIENFQFTITAKVSGIENLPQSVPPNAGYGFVIQWQNIPEGYFVYPPPDSNNQSVIGWIPNGTVSMGIGYFPTNIQSQIATYPTPNYGNGSLAADFTALRPSVLNWATNWMELFAPCIQNLCLNELTLPGAHDASTYCASGVTQYWVQTQYQNINQQLSQGIRDLDLRMMVTTGTGDNQFVMCHGSVQLNLTLVAFLNQVTQFLSSNPQEIVILDLHDFQGTWTTQNYQDVANLIISTIGENYLLPPSAFNQTLEQIWATSGRVVVGAWEFPSSVSNWIQQNTPFWSNAVHQYWCGESVTNWSDVANYLQTTLNGFTEPQNELSSLMAQYNYSTNQSITAYGVPVNIPVEISNFFAGSNGLQSNIIATDWWNRVNATTGQQELNINNFSTLINAVPFNCLKGYRKLNNQSLW